MSILFPIGLLMCSPCQVYCRCLPGSRALAMTLTSGLVFTVFSDLNDAQAQEPVDPASI